MWYRLTCRSAGRRSVRNMASMSHLTYPVALHSSMRMMQTPLGGLEDPLPPSFGRTQAKGEISTMNLRRRRQQRVLREKHKKKLLPVTSTSSSSSVSLAQVKRELQQLIRRNAIYSGRRNEDASLNITVQYATVDENAGSAKDAEVNLSHLQSRALNRQRITEALGDEDAVDEDKARRNMRSVHSSMEAQQTRNAEPSPASPTLAQHLCDAERAEEDTSKREGDDKAVGEVTALTQVEQEYNDSNSTAPINSDDEEDMTTWAAQQSLERSFAIRPGSTVFGSDLDRLEEDMMREYDQRHLPTRPLDAAFTEYGAGRRGRRLAWLPSSSFDRINNNNNNSNGSMNRAMVDEARITEKIMPDTECGSSGNAPYHMSAEAYRHAHSTDSVGTSLCNETIKDAGNEEEMPAEANPHFPCEADCKQREGEEDDAEVISAMASQWLASGRNADRVIKVDARTAYKPNLVVSNTTSTSANGVQYDAYYQRPSATQGLPAPRGEEYWANAEHRATLAAHAAQRRRAWEREFLLEGAVDTSEVEYSLNRVRKETLLYFRAHPMNEMIQESYVRIRQIMPGDGSPTIYFDAEKKPVEAHTTTHLTESTTHDDTEPPDININSATDTSNDDTAALSTVDSDTTSVMEDEATTQALALQQLRMDVDVPVQEARRMAQRLGLDLIRIGSIHTQRSDRRIVALCLLGDHREHMREMLKFKIGKLGVQPPPTRECIEVGFRGGIHPHGIRFKSIGIAKHLLRRHAIRINLTKFGTPREAFPVLQTILDEIKLQCLRLKAYHKAGQVMANYDEVYCYLYPSTGKSPKTTVEHPSLEEMRAACEYHIAANEKEIYFDDLHGQRSARDYLRYVTKLEQGTAWADKDAGLSLQRQRAIKVMLGYLPKGNNELYAARGDVNVPAPFRARHPTTIDAWDYPQESNLEQASRGAATLGKRAAMHITEMHDRDETADNPTTLDHFYYRVRGAALEVGELKEAFGLKNNRRRRIPFGQGFATLGMPNGGTSAPPAPFTVKE